MIECLIDYGSVEVYFEHGMGEIGKMMILYLKVCLTNNMHNEDDDEEL